MPSQQDFSFSSTSPAAPTGYRNTIPQLGGTDPALISNYIPNVGGVDARTGSGTISIGDQGKAVTFTSSSAVTATLDSTVPNFFWCVVVNEGTGTVTLSPSTGSILPSAATNVSAGTMSLLFFDGTNWNVGVGGGGGGGGSVTFSGDLSGTSSAQEVVGILNKLIDGTVPTDGQILQYSATTGKWELLVDRPIFPVSAVAGKPAAGQIVAIYTAAAAMIFPANFATPNSYGSVGTNPTATATYGVYKNGSNVGSISISTSGVFTFTTVGGATFSLNAADRLTIVAPAVQDTTLSDVGITLVGTRSATVPAVAVPPIFTWMGAYNGSVTYGIDNVVSYANSTYVCISPTTGNLPTNATYWSLMAAGGSTWYNGSGAPSGGTGVNGDYYLDVVGNTIYQKQSGSWVSIGTISGATVAGVQDNSYTYFVDSGTANAYAVTMSPAPSSLVAGLEVIFKVGNSCTGASTLAVNSFGTKSLTKSGTTALSANDIVAGQIVTAVYDGTQFQLQGVGGGGGALKLLEAHTASSSAELDFTASIGSSFDEYIIEIVNLLPTSNAVGLLLQFSSNGGTSYDTTAANYTTMNVRYYYTTNINGDFVTASNGISIEASLSNVAANGGLCATIKLFSPLSTTMGKRVRTSVTTYDTNVANSFACEGNGFYNQTTTACNAFRLILSSGNIASGGVRCYGVQKS